MFKIEFDLSLFTYLYLESFLPQGHNKNNDQVLHFVYIVFLDLAQTMDMHVHQA